MLTRVKNSHWPPSTKEVLTTFEAAALCHVNPLSVRNWIDQGKLSAYRTPGGHRRILREDLERFLREQDIPLDVNSVPRILIVDDEEAIVRLVERSVLEALPTAEVGNAGNGFDAGQKIHTFKPDLMVLDLKMPGLDGFQVCSGLKSNDRTRHIQVVAITGYHTQENVDRILACGASHCLKKPIDFDSFRDLLQTLLGARAELSSLTL